MSRSHDLDFLIHELDPNQALPQELVAKQALFRALCNVYSGRKLTADFFETQDAYLQALCLERGITSLEMLEPVNEAEGLYLWRGDITTLAVDGIVNAANSQMLGCFVPGHHCIDNAIHSFAGLQLRLSCLELILEQGHAEPTGQAKLTAAFNLPSRYVLHTVGPIVEGDLTAEHFQLLATCYRSCLDLAVAEGMNSIAFPCISTGEFSFPQLEAAHIAISTVREYLKTKDFPLKVVFNVFTDTDERIYDAILRAN